MFLKSKIATSIVLASALFAGAVNAGTEAGDGVLGGQVSFQNIDNDASETDSVTASVNASYFITAAVEVGGVILANTSETEDDAGNETKSNLTAVGLRGQYNFMTDSDVVPFAGAGVLFAYSDIENDNFDDSDSFGQYEIFAGSRFFVAENVAIRAEINRTEPFDDDDGGDVTTLRAGVEWFF